MGDARVCWRVSWGQLNGEEEDCKRNVRANAWVDRLRAELIFHPFREQFDNLALVLFLSLSLYISLSFALSLSLLTIQQQISFRMLFLIRKNIRAKIC